MARSPVRDEFREENRGEPRLQRRVKGGFIQDKFFIDPRFIPEGVSYEWKREDVYGAKDRNYELYMAANHWSPVDSKRIPGFMAPEYTGPVRRDGMILMERPSYLTEEALMENYNMSRQQVTGQKAALKEGATHPSMPRVGASIRSTFEPLIPDE